jgi:hypothetical protein
MKKENKPFKFTKDTKLNIGDYFRAYKSKYYTLIKDIAEHQRDYQDFYGEYYITMVKVDIYDKEEKLLAENSIVPMDKIISGALAKYIPDLDYDPTYLGSIDPYDHYAEYKIWKDMTRRCYDCKEAVFPYIGGVGTLLCDRWKCFEYFLADIRHMEGYSEAKDLIHTNHHYIVDLYDIQKHIHPSNRIYAPGYVKLKPFKQSDICKYYNLPISNNNYPKDLVTTTKYITGEIDIKETLFKIQTGINVTLDIYNTVYYYDNKIGYQPLVAMVNPYTTYAYSYYQQPLKEMCIVVRKE